VARLHIGLESPLDLIEDLERAFGATRDALRRSA
jgi:cystathionine beta-lyase